MATTMKAVVIHEAGGPEVLKIEQLPIPNPQQDEVLIHVKAFGLNRSELFTRQGYSPSVKFPRVLGIEAAGVVEKCPSGRFKIGQKVATAMGGMGRDFNGGYAEYTCVKADNTQGLDTDLDWTIVGAVPEMLQTSYGCLFKALKLRSEDRLLIRGGTTSVGLAAAAIAKNHGCFVAGTTRNAAKATAELMHKSGVDQVIIDDGQVAEQVKDKKFDKVLELVGTSTLKDSLRCAVAGGIVCMAGIVGNSWTMKDVSPMELIPHTVCLTVYSGGPAEFKETPLNDLLKQIEAGTLPVQIGKVFKLDDIVEAHDTMEKNLARGKIVILTG
ncbi:oxidoreductase [Cladophialophora psammophila CBS 110553]|uniref:Oxidoreductase n=1 Tax=Cladophialophora psammophila CBS 110553 TaxID=1182543 RepID=W9WNM8_9EURO|nr:oxidoreductase [Cladophialophora psammophila CBS 110553]EXJ69468.1 oxidoreductase [Cladophialophora psammophila CBS 110553]